MEVSPENLQSVFTSFQVRFNKAFSLYEPPFQPLVETVPSGTRKEEWTIDGGPPSMKQWKDTKQVGGLRAYTFDLANLDWESTIRVDRNNIEDDRLGIYQSKIDGLAIAARAHPGKLAFELIRDGESGLTWDGKPYFSATHAWGDSGTIDNILTGTGTTIAQIQADWRDVLSYFMLIKDDRGEPMGIEPSTVMCHPDLKGTMDEVFGAATISGTDNVLKGKAAVMANPYLTDPNDWHAFVTNRPEKPLIHQVRSAPRLVSLTSMDAERVFLTKEFLFGVEGRYAVGYRYWTHAVKVTNT